MKLPSQTMKTPSGSSPGGIGYEKCSSGTGPYFIHPPTEKTAPHRRARTAVFRIYPEILFNACGSSRCIRNPCRTNIPQRPKITKTAGRPLQTKQGRPAETAPLLTQPVPGTARTHEKTISARVPGRLSPKHRNARTERCKYTEPPRMRVPRIRKRAKPPPS